MNPKVQYKDRYCVQMVGGGWDLYVVFDRTKGHCASAHSTDNWVATFRDDLAGFESAKKKAEALNNEHTL